MRLEKEKLEQLVTLVRRRYPGWIGFRDERFLKDEIHYKKATISKAADLLGRVELQALLRQQQFDEIIRRLEMIGRDNNLLWLVVPRQGDLRILYNEGLDKPSFCASVFDLLHGEGDGPERLGRYLDYVSSTNLPNLWTFPTYFLFICHPEDEIFVKPTPTKRFLELVGSAKQWSRKPTAATYAFVRELGRQLLTELKEYGPEDMVDIQSLIWVCAGQFADDRWREFEELFSEFVRSYLLSADGKRHKDLYEKVRTEGRENFDAILRAADRGEDITQQVLLKLLPYTDSESNRRKGAWVHVAPSITGDIEGWFQNKKWVKAEDWPRVAQWILRFLRRCREHPQQLQAACDEFCQSPYSKGFQTGMLTPILNATRPSDFLIINNKSRQVMNYFAKTSFSQSLLDYPAANQALHQMLDELGELMVQEAGTETPAPDLFDIFSHWLVAIKKHSFRDANYWKIAPGENAWQWDECREGGFVAMGWDELGDLTGISRADFNARCEELLGLHPDWTRERLEQVWKFARIREGDWIVANRGTNEVLGIGKVVGPYYFDPNVRYGHRLPVDWVDLTPRRVDEGGWRRTLVKLDRQKFEEICNTSARVTVNTNPACPFSEYTFDLLAQIHETPTRQFYNEHHEEFKQQVEQPLQRLFREVASRLPAQITDRLETAHRIFSRIPKNDWGRGGAWDFYWGAFYPKGSKRIEDAQLFIWINRHTLEFGFFIGEYAREKRQRFMRRVRESSGEATDLLRDLLSSPEIKLGSRGRLERGETPLTFEQWLVTADESEVASVTKVLPKEEVLKRSEEELVDEIQNTFLRLFPLILLASEDDPWPAISEYLDALEEPVQELQPRYTIEDFVQETGFSRERIESWVRRLERKRHVVFQGPPGTGKTFIAERLARHMVSDSAGFWEVVQFHPSYAYEDFVQGIRPEVKGEGVTYKLTRGRFLEFCRRAVDEAQGAPCVLIIDEINRAHLSRVFGELMYLLEYRGKEIPLAAGGRPFRIPENVYLIGTMNTADRSIALVDHALRRRFSFIWLEPAYDVLRSHLHRVGYSDAAIEDLVRVLGEINATIGDRNYSVGISFFLSSGDQLSKDLPEIWQGEIEPYLEEFFYDQPGKVEPFRWESLAKDRLKSWRSEP